jgi:MFS family permease
LRESSSLSRNFTALLAARSLSWVGDGMTNVALIIYLQRIEGTGVAVGLLLLVTMLPSVFAPLTGVVVDRVDRRTLLIGTEYAQAVLGAVIVVWLPSVTPLLVLVFVKSIAATLTDIAGRSAIPGLVDGAQLVRANAWFGGARQAADVIGPLLGGLIVAAASVRAAIFVDVASFVLGVLLLLRLPRLRASAGGSDGVLADARAGLGYIARDRIVRAATIGFLVMGLGAANDVALPFLVRDVGAGDVGVGVVYAAVAAGLIFGFALLARANLAIAPLAGFVAGGVVHGLGDVLTGLAGTIMLVVAFQFVRGIGAAAVDVNLQTLLQRSVPSDMLGRVFANVYGAVGVAAAVSTGVAGPLLDATSPGTVLVLAGVVEFVAAGTTTLLARDRP